MAKCLYPFTATNLAWKPDAAGSEFKMHNFWPMNDGFGCGTRSREWSRARIETECVNDGFHCGSRRSRRSRDWSRARIGRETNSRGYDARFGVRWIRAPRETAFLGGTRVTPPAGKQQVLRSFASMDQSPLSCVFVGPIETAEKSRLEALYQQARDSYYSGQPLVVDEMFDRVEMQLRWHGSKLVLKYPRCSLKRFTAYADAEVDPSQMRALKTIWSLIFALGLSLAVGIPTFVAKLAFKPQVQPWHTFPPDNSPNLYMFLAVVSFLVGAPVAQAAVKQLQALGRGDLVALKGCCPNCGEEVYTFVKPDQSSLKARHESECHNCERQLVFQASILCPSKLGQPWAHGRVYLQAIRVNQLT